MASGRDFSIALKKQRASSKNDHSLQLFGLSILAREYGIRRLVLHKFPFVVVYVTEPALVIVAVAHTKRRPDYWIVRLQQMRQMRR